MSSTRLLVLVNSILRKESDDLPPLRRFLQMPTYLGHAVDDEVVDSELR